jgi:alkylation response protein AidB-like acyl-CoA dehydrogenase
MAIAQAGSPAQRDRWLPAIAAGAARGAVALSEAGLDWRPEAVRTRAEPVPGGGFRLSGVKEFVAWGHVADVVLVPARGPDGLALFLVEPSSPGLAIGSRLGMDPGTRWSTLSLDGARVPADGVLGSPGDAAALVAETLRRGAVGAAAEMLGAARRCLDMSVAYARVREQFGQPIGAFQAIRHRCAEMLLEVENAHAATYYAAWALDAGADDRETAASVAKAYVGDATRRVCGDAIQVHGGIGFTWEYDLHLYMKRQKALEVAYGDADYHRDLIVARVAP